MRFGDLPGASASLTGIHSACLSGAHTMKRPVNLACATALALVAGCASKPESIKAAYVSPLTYEPYTCEQLAAEAQRVSARASEAAGVQQKKAQGDAVATGVALVLFWPAVFFIKGKGANEAELARLKGEMETIEQVSIQKNCGFQFQSEQQAQAPQPQVIPADPALQ